MLSDGRQARLVAKDIGDKIQVVIDGARGMFGQLLNPSNIYPTFRQQANKRCGTGNKIGDSTGGQRHRRSQVLVFHNFVMPAPHG
jgi:hypothetical protein